jgi:hypothetical protein
MLPNQVAIITADKISAPEFESRVGKTWTKDDALNYTYEAEEAEWENEVTKWLMYDDDGVVHYGGFLRNDGWCIAQQMLLAWGAADTGCTRIMVYVNGQWTQEIS